MFEVFAFTTIQAYTDNFITSSDVCCRHYMYKTKNMWQTRKNVTSATYKTANKRISDITSVVRRAA